MRAASPLPRRGSRVSEALWWLGFGTAVALVWWWVPA